MVLHHSNHNAKVRLAVMIAFLLSCLDVGVATTTNVIISSYSNKQTS